MSEERVDLSNDMTWRQMVAVGVRESSLREESSINSRGQDMLREEGRVAPRGEGKGPAGSGVVAERGRGERRDGGRSDKRENDESGTTARWHEGCRMQRESARDCEER